MRYYLQSLRRFLVVAVFIGSSATVHAELTLTESPTAAAIRTMLDGPGLVLGSVQITQGTAGQYGLFTGGKHPAGDDPVLNIDSGLYMTTGNRHAILGPNNLAEFT